MVSRLDETKTDTSTQRAQIRAALLAGDALTQMDALRRFGSFRLGARIWELKREGLAIEKEMVETSGGARVAQYRLVAPLPGQIAMGL